MSVRTCLKISTESLLGELYSPEHSDGRPLPGLVILPSSAGVCDVRERFYARFFAEHGCRCLVVDSFSRRGLSECMTDQSLLSDREMLEDARVGFRWLAARKDIGKIGVLGVSKGGLAALNAALSPMPGMHPTSESFDLHVSIAPSCAIQPRHLHVTGIPVLMLLGSLDDYTGTEPAIGYAKRLGEAGLPLETVILPGARHGWELCGKPLWLPQAERYADCLFYLEDDGSITDSATGTRFSYEQFRHQMRGFAQHGAYAGGGTGTLRRKGAESILDFMRRKGFLPCPLKGYTARGYSDRS